MEKAYDSHVISVANSVGMGTERKDFEHDISPRSLPCIDEMIPLLKKSTSVILIMMVWNKHAIM